MHYTNGLDKQAFLDYMFQEFPSVFCNSFSREMLENIVNYGTADNFTHTKNELYYFLKDMIPEVEPRDLIPFMDENMLTNEVSSLMEGADAARKLAEIDADQAALLSLFDFSYGYYEWTLAFANEEIWTLDDGSGAVSSVLKSANISTLEAYVDACVEQVMAAVAEADVYEFDDDDYRIIKEKMVEAFKDHFGIEDKSVDDLITTATTVSRDDNQGKTVIEKERDYE